MTEPQDDWATGWLSHWMTESLDDRVTEWLTIDTYWHLLTFTDTYWHSLTLTDTYWHLLTLTDTDTDTDTDHLSLQDQIHKSGQEDKDKDKMAQKLTVSNNGLELTNCLQQWLMKNSETKKRSCYERLKWSYINKNCQKNITL